MRGQVDGLRRLADDIRLAAAQEHALHLDLRPGSLAVLLADACHGAAPRYSAKGVGLRCDPGPPGALVEADADRIGQVLANLLDNALRHTPSGSTVALAARTRGGTAEITVVDTGADTGDGIPADQLEAVFDRFHRLDPARSGGGSGLGLTIARRHRRGPRRHPHRSQPRSRARHHHDPPAADHVSASRSAALPPARTLDTSTQCL